jgi:hypothetical protein
VLFCSMERGRSVGERRRTTLSLTGASVTTDSQTSGGLGTGHTVYAPNLRKNPVEIFMLECVILE